jgi:hypothetical protein
MSLSFVLFALILVSCTSETDTPEYNEQIYAVYQLVVTNANFDGTYEGSVKNFV